MARPSQQRGKLLQHALEVAYHQFGYEPFKASELMAHLDSALFSVTMLHHLRDNTELIGHDGDYWWIVKP